MNKNINALETDYINLLYFKVFKKETLRCDCLMLDQVLKAQDNIFRYLDLEVVI